MGHPHPLFRLFSSFQSLQLLLQIYVKNVHPGYGFRIRIYDLQNVSPPMTTRPGLMPKSSSYNSKLHCAHFDKGSLRRNLIKRDKLLTYQISRSHSLDKEKVEIVTNEKFILTMTRERQQCCKTIFLPVTDNCLKDDNFVMADLSH